MSSLLPSKRLLRSVMTLFLVGLLVASPIIPFVSLASAHPAQTVTESQSQTDSVASLTNATSAAQSDLKTFEVSGVVSSSTQLNSPRGIAKQGQYAYVTSIADNRMTVVDLSDKTSPQIVGSVQDGTALSTATGIAVDGNYAYVVAQGSDGIAVVDIADPTAPVVVATLNPSGMTSPRRVVKQGDKLYIAGFTSSSVHIIDVSDPKSPSVTGSITNSDKLNGARRLAVDGSYAYVTASESDRLTILNIKDAANPTVAGSVQSPQLNNGYQVRLSDDTAFVGARTADTLTAVDISDRSNPTVLGSITDGTLLNGISSISIKQDHYAYVTAAVGDRVTTIDISDPANMEILESYQDTAAFDGPDTAITDGNYVYITATESDSVTALRVGQSISGRVVNQEGDPVKGATVRAWPVNVSQYQVPTEDLTNQIVQDFGNVSSPIPSSWKPNLTLAGAGGDFRDTDQLYVAATQKNLHDNPMLLDSADISDPKLVFTDASEPIILTAWDPTNGGFMGVDNTFLGNEYDQQLWGKHVADQTIVIEKLSGSNEVVEGGVMTVETSKTIGGGFLDPSSLSYAEVNLNPGYYRVSAKGSTFSYVIQVGDPASIVDDALRTASGELTKQAQQVRDYFGTGKWMQPMAVQTNSTGHFQISVLEADAKRIYLQSYKGVAPNVDADDLEIANLRKETHRLQQTGDTSSLEEYIPEVYLPSQPQVAELPSKNNKLVMHEVTYPQYGDLKTYDQLAQDLWNRLMNGSFADLPAAFQQRLSELSDAQLRQLYSELDALRQQNDRLDQRVQDLLGDSNPSINPNDATTAELRERISALQQSMTELQSTINATQSDATVADNVASAKFRFDQVLNKKNVVVIGHWSDGTSQIIDERYVTIEKSLGNQVGVGSTTVSIDNFPIDENDPASIVFEARVVTEDGIGRSKAGVTNPAFNGEVPKLSSVYLSSIAPGVDDTVTIDVNPATDSSFRNLTDVKIFGPGGATVATTAIENGQKTTFVTDGKGIYTVQLHMQTFSGAKFVETFRVRAGESVSRPHSIRAMEGPTGYYALVGDGLTAGDIEVSTSSDQVTVTAILNQSAEIPSRIHVYSEGLSTAPSTLTTVRVVRGEERGTVARSVGIVLHGKALPENAIVYRISDGKRPITDKATLTGKVTMNPDATSIETYTQENGHLEIRVIANPTTVQRIIYYARLWNPVAAMAPLPVSAPAFAVETIGQAASGLLGEIAMPGVVSTPAAIAAVTGPAATPADTNTNGATA